VKVPVFGIVEHDIRLKEEVARGNVKQHVCGDGGGDLRDDTAVPGFGERRT
jgi:hypothetical protein